MHPAQHLFRLGFGFAVSQCLRVAIELGLADVMDGERSVEELAQACGADPGSLYRILRVLAAEGVVRETTARHFELTESGRLLRSDVAASPRDFILMMNSEPYLAFEQLLHAVRTGEPTFEKVFGQPRFEWLDSHPDKAAVFQRAMAAMGLSRHGVLAEAYDFSPYAKVADIGGAHGQFIAAILERNPHLGGILFDRPASIAAARRIDVGRMPRLELVEGDFFKAVPQGADVYVIKKVIHDWNDEQSISILRNCRKVIPAHGRVLIAETIVPPGNEPHQIKLIDVTMLAVTGGRERTEAEYAQLLGAAGFALERVIPTREAISLIEGRPV